MVNLKHAMAASALLALAFASPPTSATSVEIESPRSAGPAGVWTGSRLQKEWTFEFKADGAGWSGRYMPPGGVKWHPLTAVRVSGRSLGFNMDSKPKLDFALEVDAAKPVMSGTVVIEGVATVPFSATRKP